MATWTKNQPAGSTKRRKWNLEDRTSLNNLKFHIASEGCSEVQYDLAKQLLDKTIDDNEESSSQQAVHWLICAAQQGHEEAANLLQKCYDEGCGITAENENEVRLSLSMTPGERAARKAARELFSCLSNGGKHITPKQLERKMREIYKMQKARRQPGDSTSTSEDEDHAPQQSLEDGSGPIANGSINLRHHPTERKRKTRRSRLNVPEPGSNEPITEENLVSAAVNYTAGRMPAVNDAMTLTIPHPSSLDHVPCFHRLIFHPIVFFTLLYHRLINIVAEFPQRVPPSVRLAILLIIYWLVSTDNLSTVLPIGFYYLCWSTMIWSTCKMLKTKHDFIDFRIWSGLFLSYGDHNIEADISENRFLRNNMQPYLYFFCAFIGNFLVYPLISEEWLPHSELTIVAGVFVFFSMLAFMYSTQRFPDWIFLISFGVNVLAKYPYEMDDVVTTGWRFLDLKVPTFCSFVIGNGIEFCLNCRTALYLLIPLFLVHLAKRSNWHGTYTHLIPHCVTLSWLQLCITSAQSATMFGVVRATLGLAGVLLFLPLFGLVSLLIPVFVVVEWLGFTNPNIRLGSTVVASMLAVLGSCVLAINRTTQKYVTALQVLICIIAASVLTFPYMTSNFKDTTRFNSMIPDLKHHQSVITTLPAEEVHMPPPPPEYLSWQRFYSHCGPQAWWKDNNKIKSQLKCAHLEGLPVSWEGDVTQVQIASVKNNLAWYIQKYLPSWMARIITCWYGERLAAVNKCEPHQDRMCSDFEDILKTANLDRKCSLHKWNSYEYEIRINMYSGLLDKRQEVVLQAQHKFGNFSKRLVEGDRVHFYGTLTNSRIVSLASAHIYEEYLLGGSPMAHIKLAAIECLQCQDRDSQPVIIDALIKSPVDARMRDLMRGIKYLLNVFLSPLITFK
ncbi:wolframin [Stomoxys calcitrans]|uniref:Wolframin n=1 Tax=Stomoxys calcitrans TaxID=35570 RepID=A0A1I8Q0D4_STOCA|nr:wolframin [Stomoxys calcitrans]XP_013101213.1 wolframin [Stomoxys calcitrans]